MAQAHPDDGFHEIQLNGKQLVFLFMAVTVVSVVIFLCGVLVGRNVRVGQIARAEQAAADAADLTPSVPGTPAAQAQSADPAAAPPAPASEDLSYFDRLEKSKPAQESLKPASKDAAASEPVRATPPAAVPAPPKPAPAPAAEVKPSPSTAALPPAKTTEPVPAASAPSGKGFAVQLAALNDRGEADAIAKRLAAKGYAAYVVAPAGGTPIVYRVRVGSFKTRREAETLADKLRKEEQFSPWVTR